MFRSACFIALTGALLLPNTSHAQRDLPGNTTYALTNTRIVVSPGRVIERGNVIVRNGRIAAVGAGAAVPADARVLDLTGSTVYPGLIDAATNIGLPAPARQQGPRTGGPPTQLQQAASRNADQPYELNAARQADDVFQARTEDFEALRALGVTTIGLTFEGGILPGQTAVLKVGDAATDSLVLRAPVAQQVALGTRRGAYPGTLMGTLAYLKQAFLDADYLLRVKAAAERDPTAGPRVPHDEEAIALGPAARRLMPVWISASRENDIRRAVALARELNLDYLLVGAQEGYKALDLLERTRPVLVSLDFPRPTAVTGRGLELRVAPASGPDSAKIKADSAAAREVRANAGALVRGGIPVALTSFGLERPRDFRDRILAVIAAGLPADEALRALTITPARALGMERLLGTIETGKLANLVVADGDLFSRSTRIKHVFVEGEKFDIREQPRQQQAERRN